MVYLRILNVVPCVIQKDLVVHPFYIQPLSFRNTFFQTFSWTVRSCCYSAQILSVVPISLRVKAEFLQGQYARQLILGLFVSP